jgi:hypothetical protein
LFLMWAFLPPSDSAHFVFFNLNSNGIFLQRICLQFNVVVKNSIFFFGQPIYHSLS